MCNADRDFQYQLERARLNAMKELAYGASHEINNPLANISARAQALLRDETRPERRRALEAIHTQALRAHEMISDLMLFARPPRLSFADVDISGVVKQVLIEVAPECEERRIRVLHDAPSENIRIWADVDQLAVAVRSAVRNSIEAIGVDGTVEVTVGKSTNEPRPGVFIIVRDDGPGVSEAARLHAFDPFFSGREAGRGLGFGLSKAWRIVTEHGGTIEFEPADQGAAVRIELPLRGSESAH